MIASLLDAEERPYPRERLNQGWEGLIYPDHGWCGEKTLETIRVFHERLQTAHDVGKDVYESSLAYIARRVAEEQAGRHGLDRLQPAVVEEDRAGVVVPCVSTRRGTARRRPASSTPRGVRRRASSAWKAATRTAACARRPSISSPRDVPPIGYKTYYLSNAAAAPERRPRRWRLRGQSRWRTASTG